MPTATGLVYQPHNHHACISGALAEARSLCQQRGVRLTQQREAVLRLVWQSHAPIGAYALLEQLPAGQQGRKPAPTAVYRALEFLRQQGLVHRLDSLNAYIGCPHPAQLHDAVFLICRDCSRVLELPGRQVQAALQRALAGQGFVAEDYRMEVLGHCPACAGKGRGGQGT